VRSYQHADSDHFDGSAAEEVRAITSEQVPAILLTALLTAAVMVPLAFSGAVAGTEILHPFAGVVLGGLVSSTIFSVFVVPAIYLRLFCRQVRQRPSPAATTPTPAAV
jgi:Cu/Ag efflux pump CusA